MKDLAITSVQLQYIHIFVIAQWQQFVRHVCTIKQTESNNNTDNINTDNTDLSSCYSFYCKLQLHQGLVERPAEQERASSH